MTKEELDAVFIDKYDSGLKIMLSNGAVVGVDFPASVIYDPSVNIFRASNTPEHQVFVRMSDIIGIERLRKMEL